MNDQERSAALQKLREPFPDEAIGTLPKGGTQLAYVGHANVTDRLLTVDPEWTWEPLATDDHGLPVFDRTQQGQPVGLWIKLTVCGVTRLGYGSVAPGAFDPVKQLIGDALRNAAMRFGVALKLWSKEEFEGVAGAVPDPPAQRVVDTSPQPSPPLQSVSVGGGAEVGAPASPTDNTKAEALALIEARLNAGDVDWGLLLRKASVAALKTGDKPPSSKAQLKELSPETLRVLVSKL